MKAKDMFEKLGYACDVSYEGILYSQYIDLPNGNVANCQIDFDKVQKTVEKEVRQAGFGMEHYNSRITFEELKAINQQVKELNWDNE